MSHARPPGTPSLTGEPRELIAQQEALVHLGQSALEGRSPDLLIEDALDLIQKHLDVPLCSVLEYVREDHAFVPRGLRGWSREGAPPRLPAGSLSQAGYTLETGSVVIIEDLRQETRFEVPQLMFDQGAVSGLSVLMNSPQGHWGVLGAHTRERRRFTRDELHFVQCVANVVASAIARELTERDLARSEAYARQLMDEAADGIYLIGPDGRVADANRRAAEMLGFSREELIGRHPRELEPEEDLESFPRDALAPGESRLLRRRQRRKDGSLVPVEINVRRLEGDRHLSFVRDISQREEEERIRRERQERMHQIQKMEAVGLLAGGVAHDFNNLLTVILGYTGVLIDRPGLDEQTRRDASRIQAAGERASQLTRQLLALSSHQVVEPVQIDLNRTIAGLREMLGGLLGERIQLITDTAPDLGPVLADPGQVEQAVVNLVLNARDVLSEGGSVVITTRNLDRDELPTEVRNAGLLDAAVTLSVADSGPGIPPANLDKLFDPFFTTKPMGKGTGLGLSSVYGILQQCGGTVTAANAEDSGAIFTLYFPRAEGMATPAPPVAPVEEAAEPRTATVLLVEDEENVRELVRSVMEANGYRVLTAANPREALFLLETETEVDLVVTDVVMPEMSGPEMARRIQGKGGRPRVLFVSGYPEDALNGRGLDPGTSFLQKPFSPQDLLRRVGSLLEG